MAMAYLSSFTVRTYKLLRTLLAFLALGMTRGITTLLNFCTPQIQTNRIKKKKMWLGIETTKCLNMHKSLYKFAKKRNKCDVIIKSTIIKITINREKSSWNNKKNHQKKNLEREREYWHFFVNNLEWIWERGGNEVKRNL